MPDLIAQGPSITDRWRRSLPSADGNSIATLVLGRSSSGWSVPWDDRISRNHAQLTWNGIKLTVHRMIDSRNPIFFKGLRRDDFDVGIGEHFVIGQTTFSLVDHRIRMVSAGDAPPAMTELTFAPAQLRQYRYRDADRRIEALSRLPEIISGSRSDDELCVRVVSMLMQGIPRAALVAVVSDPAMQIDSDDYEESAIVNASNESSKTHQESGIRVLHWDSRSTISEPFAPSARLIQQALKTQQSVLNIWNRNQYIAKTSFTQSENVDWAFCTPILGEACPGWAIYVAGDFSGIEGVAPQKNSTLEIEHGLQDELKFAELTATTISSLRQTRLLLRRQDSLRPFFAPVVQRALATADPDQVLAPRETDVSVLFCDLRGFSRRSEESSDRLLELLQRVSDALGVMTHHILSSHGVVGDFHGDAAMGFWGWPLAQSDAVHHAAHAALAIRAEFEDASKRKDHPLFGFRAGLGLATGRAVAGRIGTVDQVKVTVFGPVVNLAARLESMTKQLQAPILIDETTAKMLASCCPESFRIRKVARVIPYGVTTPLTVSELLPPEGEGVLLSNEHIRAYEQALECLQAGDWDAAFRLLHHVPAEDRVKDFLTVFIAQHGRTPPADWQGIIPLPNK
ncbi:MAG: adenylate/guanylate cyclase domain-containing protein [Pirellula sp.]|jgi:adenylate cyclase